MIHALLQQILQMIAEQAPGIELTTSPLPELHPMLPAIAIYAGQLTTRPMDPAQPLMARRVPVAQRIELDSAQRGPFKLEHRPYRGSLSIHLLDAEQKNPTLSEQHYTVDTAAQEITFTEDAPCSGAVSAVYDITGLTLVQDFEQELIIDVRTAEPGQAESLAAVAAAIVLTASEELTRRASANLPTPHAGRFRAASTIQSISLQRAQTGARGGRYTLHFSVQGQLKMIREMDKSMT